VGVHAATRSGEKVYGLGTMGVLKTAERNPKKFLKKMLNVVSLVKACTPWGIVRSCQQHSPCALPHLLLPQRPGMAYNRQTDKDAAEEERGDGATAEARVP
jgi:hypothetical protein